MSRPQGGMKTEDVNTEPQAGQKQESTGKIIRPVLFIQKIQQKKNETKAKPEMKKSDTEKNSRILNWNTEAGFKIGIVLVIVGILCLSVMPVTCHSEMKSRFSFFKRKGYDPMQKGKCQYESTSCPLFEEENSATEK